MAEQKSPQAPNEWQTRRSKLAWRALLIFNLAVGAYIFSRPRKKDTSVGNHRKALETEVKEEIRAEEEAVSQPIETMPTHDYDYDYDMLVYDSQTSHSPEKFREQIPEDHQRELFEWMIEEKRKVEPKDREEKERIDVDKAILKRFIRGKSVPRF